MSTLQAIRQELRRTLADLEDGDVCAEWILEDAAGIPRLRQPLRGCEPLEEDRVAQARAWAARAAAGEPIQYILGWTSFRGHRILSDPRALIPRPETEELVSHVRDAMAGAAVIADVGTGTGCIAIALCLEEPGVTALAIDREPAALALAAENVAAHGLQERINLREADLLDGVADGSVDVVVSNPPYVAEDELADLPRNVRDFEPWSALAAGRDGLDVIRRLIPQARCCLRPGGKLFMEIGETHSAAVAWLLHQSGFRGVGIVHDLTGRDRIAHGILI